MIWKWPTRILREEAGTGEGGAGGGGGTTPLTSFKIGGKEVSVEDATTAVNLFNALNDPNIGIDVITSLASKAGILDKKGDLNVTESRAEKILEGKVTKMLRTKLGKDYEKFADSVGPALDEAIQSYLEDHKVSTETRTAETAWGTAVESFTDSHATTPTIERQMTNLIQRNGGVPAHLSIKEAKEYLEDMYELAIHKLGIELPDNPKESKPRSRRGVDDVPEFREEARPKGRVSIDDAVEAAIRGVRFR